ncbi:TerB family tellurite resistance protein [Wenzhouxiangella sp. XN79A]|uniref:tellurite resistance TerB family protein n=1 Tax=Wenzhouxiangella sp. XN79A TaxID=2724193 RepID=UPI00144AC768|nr:TerB family tellurite resistance protein [Wenzhouxiangella sp. XN79A]NKI35028.1 TerB family tellurite resistance protein [Wenzhouxiangella sp. XN79A]
MADFLQTLRDILHSREPDDAPQALPRAAAVLLLEMAVTDEGGDAAERAIIERAIAKHFELPDGELTDLIAEAERLRDDAVSLHEFTHQLRAALDAERRADLVEWLWRVAFADGRLGHHEEHLVRRLADLLGVPHREFIRRKHAASPE